MKNIIFFITLILCMIVSSATAQNATRRVNAVKVTNFTNLFDVNEHSKGITVTEEDELTAQVEAIQNTIRSVITAANIPNNYIAGKTATSDYNPVLKQAAATNRASQSQPINIRKTVVVQ